MAVTFSLLWPQWHDFFLNMAGTFCYATAENCTLSLWLSVVWLLSLMCRSFYPQSIVCFQKPKTKPQGLVLTQGLCWTCLAAKKASSILSCVRRNVASAAKEVILTLSSSLLVPYLECWIHFWGPLYRKDIDTPERVQWRATKITEVWEHLSCEERLGELELFHLEKSKCNVSLI